MPRSSAAVLESLDQLRADRKKKVVADTPKYITHDPAYAAPELVPELRTTKPKKQKLEEAGADDRTQRLDESDDGVGLPDAQTLQGLTLGLRPVRDKAQLDSQQPSTEFGPDVFERASPRARATLRTFLCDFLVDDARGNVHVRRDIDLANYRKEALRPVTNSTIQEICVMQPRMLSLNVCECEELTDASLLCLARHCPELEALLAHGIPGFTRVGLRALALGCPRVATLELSRCASLDDDALNAIAASLPNLKQLVVEDCAGVTDDGLAVLASGCRHMTRVDVSGCPRVGEFGDRALLALGRYCQDLVRLDMFGCAHVQDAGIIAVARGCPQLEELRVTGCRELSGKALSKLARCRNLRDLSIAGCERVKDADLCRLVGIVPPAPKPPPPPGGELLARARARANAQRTPSRQSRPSTEEVVVKKPPQDLGGVHKLQRLDVSHCPDVRARGIGAIAQRCPDLQEVTLVGCTSVGDDACEMLARYSQRLRHLDLSDCQRVSESGVGVIGRNITGLAKLNVTGCKKVGRRFLLDLIDELQFCDLARDYVGYQPKKNANWLRKEAERKLRELGSIIKIQALYRGALWRTGLGAYWRRVFFERCVTKLQACERARTWRKRVAAIAQHDREDRAATWFAATYRGKIARRIIAKWNLEARRVRTSNRAAVICQRTIRSHRAKRRVESFRRAVEAMRLDAARLRARQEWKATMLQASLRGMLARQEALRIRTVRDGDAAETKARATSALRIQAQYRASLGRDEATRRRDARAYRRWLWRTARTMQSWLRGCWGRMRAAAVRKAKGDEIKNQMATKIQAAWRAAKSRYLATIHASLEALRAQEKVAVVRIQATARSMFARHIAEKKREAKRILEVQGVACALIQRILRGHYGRTAWEVAKRQVSLQDRAAPLYARLNLLLDESREAAGARDDATEAHAEATKEVTQIEAELRELSRVGHDTWDTGRLSQGYKQRYKTSYLKNRIIELLANKRICVVEFADMAREKTIVARDKARLIREVQREIRPLADGLAERTRRERVHRLRENVRKNKAMATRLQTLTRGVVCRQAFDRLLLRGVDQWLVLECELSGDPYFYNRFTEERRDVKPLELDYGVIVSRRDFCLRGRIGRFIQHARDNNLLEDVPDDDPENQTVQTQSMASPTLQTQSMEGTARFTWGSFEGNRPPSLDQPSQMTRDSSLQFEGSEQHMESVLEQRPR